jgi:hypothetical protein
VQDEEGSVSPRQVFGLEYYRTLIVRLYNFNGQANPGGKPTVVTYQDVKDVSGIPFKLVVDAKEFVSYQDALNYIATQDSTKKYEIISLDPFVSPIPLEAVEDYQLVYSSANYTNTTVPEIKIFEYIGDN